MHLTHNLGEPTMATTESYLECTEPATVAWERLGKAPVSAAWSAGLGLVYLVGRALYLRGYVADPAKREIGFGLSVLPLLVLLLGALWGAGSALL